MADFETIIIPADYVAALAGAVIASLVISTGWRWVRVLVGSGLSR